MTSSAFLAVDWGTTNLRAWVVDADGGIGAHQEFALGVGRLAPGEAASRFADTVRPRLEAEDLPAILCGMVGSNLGWAQVPYVPCPAGLDALAQRLHVIEGQGPAVAIVPGLRCLRPDGAPDVLRGEETPVLGWAAADAERQRGRRIVCHPGTHAKWVRLADGAVERFVTSMTGELFDVLSRHSVLKSEAGEDDDAAFLDGVHAAGNGGALASRLFTARSRVVGGDMASASARSYLSGLLIGAEAASLPGLIGAEPGEPVALVGDLGLCERYRRGFEAQGLSVTVHDGEEAVLAGLKALFAREDAPR